MTRYEKFMQSINTPEKLVGFIDEAQSIWGHYIFNYDYCQKCPCPALDEDMNTKCIKCHLKYLNEEIKDKD